MTTNGIMIRPVTITDAMLTSSNAVETADEWDDGHDATGWTTFYDAGALVLSAVAGNHRLYESQPGPFIPLETALLTVTAANPAVVTCAGHGLSEYDPITIYDTTGALSTALYFGLPYLVHVIDANTFNLYDANSPPIPGTYVDTTGHASTGYQLFVKGDPNTGYWGDPADTITQDYVVEHYAFATLPRWLDVGPNNTWAMFDALNGSATTHDDDLEVVIEPGTRVDALGMESVIGSSVRIVVNDGASDVYDTTYPMIDNSEVVDWYTFFFAERRQRSTLVVSDLPAYVLAPEITVTIAEAGDLGSACGTLQVGRQFDIGGIQYGLGLGIRDYSLKETDDFGNYSVVERAFSKKAEARAMLPNTRADIIQTVLAAYRATPVFWSLAEDFTSSAIFGFYRSFNIEITYPENCLVSYEIEGVGQ